VKDCRKCKDYRDCPGKLWYHYGEIRWCPYQVIFILYNTEVLRPGGWPDNPDGSSYIDSKVQTGFKSEAYFIKPVGILAEVEYRRKRTGVDGKLLKEQAENGKDITMLEPEALSALMYIKGWRRKRIDYKRWLREVYYAPKTGEKHQFNRPA